MYKSLASQLIIIFVSILWSGALTASVKTRQVEVPTRWGNFSAEIHYRDWERGFVDRVEQVLLKDCLPLFNYFRYVPKGTVHFSTEQEASSANGSATVLYGNRIVLNNFPPLTPGHLSYNGDWVQLLVIHELTHLIHMDQTNGFPDFLRSVFGFYGKWNGIAPSWFLEGVAVWAESRFTDSGRLRNKRMRYEFDASLFDKKGCSSIDCLDDPGHYPYRQYAYWAGAYFMEYLEESFPGTIRCLVKDNSYYFPGFLGQVFLNCLKLPAGGLYQLFKQSRIQELASMPTARSLKELQYQKEGEIVWQKGVSLIDNRFFAVERDLAREHFVEIDLDSGAKSRFDFDYMIEHLPFLSAFSSEKKIIPLSLFTVSGGDYLRHAELWKVSEQDSIQDIDFDNRRAAHYLFLLKEDDDLVIKNEKEVWTIRRREKLITSLSALETLNSPTLVNINGKERLVIKSFKQGVGYRLLMHSLNKGAPWQLIYKAENPFEFFDKLGQSLLVRTGKGILEKVTVKGNRVTISRHTPSWGPHLVDFRSSKNRLIALWEGRPGSILVGDTRRFEDEINSSLASTKTFEIRSVGNATSKVLKRKEEGYPSLRHFIPQGWYLTTESGNTSYYGFNTDFQDPRGHHTFSLSGLYFDSYEKFAPTVGYQYNWRGRDRFILSGRYHEDYSWSNYSNSLRKDRSSMVQMAWRFPIGRWEKTISLAMSRDDFDNFSTIVVQKKYSIQEIITYQSLFDNAFIHDFSLLGLGHQYEAVDFEKFYGVELKTILGFQFHRRLRLSFTGNWGRLYKDSDSIASGFLEAGEKENVFYHVYGVEYSDIFGLKLATARAQFDWNIKEVYSGSGLLPVFVKRVHLFSGVDRFKSQYFYAKGTLFRDKTFSTAHIGLRLEGIVGFYLPSSLDITYARVLEFHDEGMTTVRLNLGI